ncbi:MAG: T9SS type A sorting domain-containing protein, partial [Syntrophothermus sp.]
EYLDGTMLNNGINYNDFALDQNNNPYFSGMYQRAFLAGDSLIAPPDSVGGIIYLSDPDLGVTWKKTTTTKVSSAISLLADGNNLYFACDMPHHANFFGQSVTFGGAEGVMTGLCDHDGNLIQYTLSPVFYKFRQNGMIRDNCGNIVMASFYEGWGIIGNDTLPYSSFSPCIAYLQTQTPLQTGLPPDTSGCGSLVLRIPPEFTHFNWNNGLSTADSLVVTQTGLYTLTASNNNYCPVTDTIIVIIKEAPGDFLGNDINIPKEDSITFAIPFAFESCTWSTGDTTGTVTLQGADLGAGTHTIWVNVVAPPCTVTDSVKITVLPGQGTNDINSKEQWFYPNPARDKVYISATGRKSNLVLLNAQGKMVKSYSLTHEKDEVRVIDLDDVSPGMYFLIEQSGQTLRRGKIIIK